MKNNKFERDSYRILKSKSLSFLEENEQEKEIKRLTVEILRELIKRLKK